MNVNPYDREISEDVLSKFASLKSMLSSQRLTMSLSAIIERKSLFSKSVGLLALKHLASRSKAEQGLNNPRFLFHNLVLNFFQRSYISKRSKILKDLFELSIRSNNEKQYNKSRLFALKYFSNSLNKTFLDFYKKLKDNKIEKLAQIKILLSSFRIANKNKLLTTLTKLSDHAITSQNQLVSKQRLQARLPRMLVSAQAHLLSKALSKLLGRKTKFQVHEAAAQNLHKLFKKPFFEGFSSIKNYSGHSKSKTDFLKTLTLLRLKFSTTRKLQSAFTRVASIQEPPVESKKNLIFFYQIVYAQKSKLFQCFQTLRNPTFKKRQIIEALEKVIGTVESQNRSFKQQFFNRIFRTSGKTHSRYAKLGQTLDHMVHRRVTKAWFKLHQIPGVDDECLFAANKIGRISLEPSEQNVSSLVLPCFVKLLKLLRHPDRELTDSNLVKNFDRYIAIRSEYDNNRNNLILHRANLKFENQVLQEQNHTLETRNKFLELSTKDLADKNRKINLEKSSFASVSTKDFESVNNLSENLEALQKQLEDQKAIISHIKSERRNLKQELSAANDEVHRHLISGQFINIEDLATNVPNKSVSQVMINPNGPAPTSIDRNEREQFEIRPKYSMEMSADESMIRKYTIEQPFSRNVRPTSRMRSIDNVSSRNFILKPAFEDRSQAETSLAKFVEESDQMRSSMEDVEREIEFSKQKLQQLEERLVHQEMRLIDVQDRRGMVVLEKNACKKHNEKDKKRLEEIKSEIQSIESKPQINEEDRLRLEVLRSDQAASFEKLRENATKIANYELKISELAEVQKELSKEISETKNEKVKAEGENKDLTDKKKSLEAEFEEKTDQIKDLKKRIGNIQLDTDDFESKRQVMPTVSKRITVASENGGAEAILTELRAQIALLEEELIKCQEEKGALVIQKSSKQKQSKALLSKISEASAKIRAIESEENVDESKQTELSNLKASKDDILFKLNELTSSIESCDQKTAETNGKIKELNAKIQSLKNELEQFEKNGPNETFLSKENLIVTFKNPRLFTQNQHSRNTFANSEFIIKDNGNGFHFQTDQGFSSSKDLKRHIGDRIMDIQKELRENSTRLDKQKQSMSEVEQLINLKTKEFHQLKFKNEFSIERLNSWNDAIKANCCLIVDYRDEQIQIGKTTSENKRKIFANRQLIFEINNKLKALEFKDDQPAKFLKTLDRDIQTENMDHLNKISLLIDKSDNIHRIQKTILFNSDLDVLQGWLPKKFELILSEPQNYFLIRVTPGMNNNSILAEIENNYSFDENGFKFIKRDPFGSKNDVEISGDYEDYFPDQSNNEINNALAPDSTNPQTNFYDSYKFNQSQVEVNFNPKKEVPSQPLNRKPPKDFPISDLDIYRNIVDHTSRLENKATSLFRSMSRPVKRTVSETLQDLRLCTSKAQLKRFLTTLYNWKLASLDANKEKLLNQAKRFKQSLFLLLHFAIKKQEFHAFKQIAFESGLLRQKAFFKLLPVAVRANVAHRKNLKDILTYWYHIKDENKWFGKVMKSMIYKSSLHPQIALWRLKLFRKKTSPISPQITKGLLYLMDWYQDKELDNIGRAFFKLSAGLRANDYSSQPPSHISEYSNEQMSEYDPFDDDDFKDYIPQSQIQESEAEQNERQLRLMKVNRLFELMSLKQKRLHLKYFHLLQRRALAPPTHAKQQGLGYQKEKQKNLEPDQQYLQNLQFIIEQNLKCKQEIQQKDRQITSLRSKLDQKHNDLLLLRNNFMFVFIEKIEKICSRHNRSEIDRSMKLFFRRLK